MAFRILVKESFYCLTALCYSLQDDWDGGQLVDAMLQTEEMAEKPHLPA